MSFRVSGDVTSPLVDVTEYDAAERARQASRASARSPAGSQNVDHAPSVKTDVTHLAGAARDQAAGEAIDATRDAYAGPYRTPDRARVSAPVMFKLAKPYSSQTKVGQLAKLVGPALAARVQSGQADPAEIVKATQALIDKNLLPSEPAGDVAGQIKTMQWQYGIGIDCACFTRHAAARAAGRAGLPVNGDLALRGLDSNPHFAKVRIADVRPGDVITLDAKPPETIGHNVVVRGHEKYTDLQARDAAAASAEPLRSFFAGAGPFHTVSVDSSWGAGENGSLRGGYRRETWLYDESTKSWAHMDHGTWKVATNAPTSWDTFHGAYRVK